MKCNRYQAPVLFAKTEEQRNMEIERHEFLLNGQKKMLNLAHAELEQMTDQDLIEWKKRQIKQMEIQAKKYEKVISELKALKF